MSITRAFPATLSLTLLLTASGLSSAESLYLYTGQDYSLDSSVLVRPATSHATIPPYTTSDSISGGFNTASPLAPNLVAATINPDYFFFEDGVTSSSSGVANSSFVIWTDAAGDIDHWDIDVHLDSGQSILTVSDPRLQFLEGQYGGVYDQTYFVPYDYMDDHGRGGNIGQPGTWEDLPGGSLPLPAPVPEPGTLALAATGLLGIVQTVRRRMQSISPRP